MNSAVTDSLSRDKIRQLLAAVGSRPSETSPAPAAGARARAEIEAAEYNWHQPHYFSREQLGVLESFTKNLAAAIAEKFAQLYHSDFDVTIVSTTQHFAGEVLGQISGSNAKDYYLAFGPDRKLLCGFISMPEQTAIAWVTQLLGEAESKEDSAPASAGASLPLRKQEVLSQLEESLLLDITSAIVAAISVCMCEFPRSGVPHSYRFEPAANILRGELPVDLPDLEELCKIAFAVQKAGSGNRSEATIVIPCSELAPLTGKTTVAEHSLSAEDIAKAIMGHLHRMPVSITAQLACTALAFEELASIRPCDILLLDKAIDEPIELIVGGRTLFRGRPAKSAGRYAVVITESVGNRVKT